MLMPKWLNNKTNLDKTAILPSANIAPAVFNLLDFYQVTTVSCMAQEVVACLISLH